MSPFHYIKYRPLVMHRPTLGYNIAGSLTMSGVITVRTSRHFVYHRNRAVNSFKLIHMSAHAVKSFRKKVLTAPTWHFHVKLFQDVR